MLLFFPVSPDEITVGCWNIFTAPAWNWAGELKIWSRHGEALTQPHSRVSQDVATKSTAMQLRLCLPAQKTSLKQKNPSCLAPSNLGGGSYQLRGKSGACSKTCACLFPNLETTMIGCLRSHMRSNHREILWRCGNSLKERKENSRWNAWKFSAHIQKKNQHEQYFQPGPLSCEWVTWKLRVFFWKLMSFFTHMGKHLKEYCWGLASVFYLTCTLIIWKIV